MTTNAQKDAAFWPTEREGYTETIRPAYVPGPPTTKIISTKKSGIGLSIATQEHLGSLIAGVGLIYSTYTITQNVAAVVKIGVWPPGPLETCAIGVILWLTAKWRRATCLK